MVRQAHHERSSWKHLSKDASSTCSALIVNVLTVTSTPGTQSAQAQASDRPSSHATQDRNTRSTKSPYRSSTREIGELDVTGKRTVHMTGYFAIGTRAFSSSNQFSTTTMLAGVAF